MPRIASFVVPMILALSCVAAPVFAQAPAPSAAPRVEDPIMARARAIWEALPLAERIAIQEDLVWATPYRGTSLGDFGRLTFNALRIITSRRPGAEEAVLTPQERAMLAAEAARARAAVGFAPVNETRSGASIGVPRKLLPRRLDVESGARFEAGDRTASLETFGMRESDGPLPAAYEALRAPQPNRRVTYSVLRPDFFVIVTEAPTQSSYLRAARGQDGAETLVRGFRLTWPKAQQARYEALAVAVANSFVPFGAKTEPASEARPEREAAPRTSPQSGEHVAALALSLGEQRFVALLPGGGCDAARIGDRPARLLRQDAATGLALFEVAGAMAPKLPLPPASAEPGQTVLALIAQENGQSAEFAAAPGETSGDKAAPRLRAALPQHAAGALVVTRDGRFLGVAAPASNRSASHALVTADRILAFAETSSTEAAPTQTNTAALAAAARPSLEALWCRGAARAAAN